MFHFIGDRCMFMLRYIKVYVFFRKQETSYEISAYLVATERRLRGSRRVTEEKTCVSVTAGEGPSEKPSVHPPSL